MVCDLAETYHIYDYRGYPLKLVGTLVFGLRDNSRIKMKISKEKLTLEQKLLARQADDLNFIAWSKTKDAQSGKNRPKSILQALLGDDEEEKLNSYKNGAEFDSAWKQMNGG